jgi:hypothetical protein
LSPNSYRSDAACYGRDEPPFYDVEEFKRLIVHELVHIWVELSSPRDAMEVRPRPGWFGEGLAMYIAKQYEEDEFKVFLRDDYENGITPKPGEMSGRRNYTWGCILVEFLLKEFGPQEILNVITNICGEDVLSSLDPDTESLTKKYMDFAQGRVKSISLSV